MTRTLRGRSCSSTSAARQSAAWPPVNENATGRSNPSVRAWILVVRPPRLIPIAWFCCPFSAGGAAVCLDVCAVEQEFGRRTACCRQFLEQLLPDASGTPSNEAVVERLAWPIDRRSVHPSATGLHDVHDPADHPPVVHPRDASGFTWQQRLKALPLPLVYAQP